MVDYQLLGIYRAQASLFPTRDQIVVLVTSFMLIPFAAAYLVNLIRLRDPSWQFLGSGLVLCLASAVTAYPRFEFFHLMGTLALAAVVVGVSVGNWIKQQDRTRAFSILLVLLMTLVWIINAGRLYSFSGEPQSSRLIAEYSTLELLAQKLKNHISPSESVFIFCEDESNSNLYYLLDSPPRQFWIFHYPWYMIPPVKARILQDLTSSPPDWVLYYPDLWNAEKTAPEIMQFIRLHYQQVDRIDSGPTLMRLVQ
jgi:hypothetical protein